MLNQLRALEHLKDHLQMHVVFLSLGGNIHGCKQKRGGNYYKMLLEVQGKGELHCHTNENHNSDKRVSGPKTGDLIMAGKMRYTAYMNFY